MSRNTMTGYSYNSHSHHNRSSNSSIGSVRPLSRQPSELLCELHVYKVPPELWREPLNNILNNVVTETVSMGIIRVPTELRLVDLREEIVNQLQLNDSPRDYVFLRSVGRSLTTLRSKQEYQLKAKHFLPPVAISPEIYILEATPEIRDALAISDRSSQSPPLSRRTSPSHRGYPSSYRNGYPGDSDTERNPNPPRQVKSPVHKYQALPQIGPASSRSHDPDSHHSFPMQTSNSHPSVNEYNQYNGGYNRHPYNGNDPVNAVSNEHTDNKYSQNQYEDTQNRYGTPSQNRYNTPTQNQYEHPPPQEIFETPGKEKSPEPETKEVVQAYHAAGQQPPPEQQQARWDRTPSPIKQSPPHSADKGRDRRHDDDSGVAGLTPDEYDAMLRKTRDMQRQLDDERYRMDDEAEAERRRRLEDLDTRNDIDKQRWEADQEERRKQSEEDRRRREEEERRIKEEKEQQEREEAERRRKDEEEKRRKEEEEKRRKDEEEKERREREDRMNQEDADGQRNRYDMSSPEPDLPTRDTKSAKQRRKDEKNELLKELEEARRLRQDQEKEREELVKKAKSMQHKTTNRRNEARDMWKKKYFEEKKKTAPLEESSNRLRQELEALHRRLMNTLEGPKEKNLKLFDKNPSRKNNYVIQCTKLQHEIQDLQRRVENAKMKLTAEMKLRNQAQGELRALRAELTQKKISLSLTRQQQFVAVNPRLKEQEPYSSGKVEPGQDDSYPSVQVQVSEAW